MFTVFNQIKDLVPQIKDILEGIRSGRNFMGQHYLPIKKELGSQDNRYIEQPEGLIVVSYRQFSDPSQQGYFSKNFLSHQSPQRLELIIGYVTQQPQNSFDRAGILGGDRELPLANQPQTMVNTHMGRFGNPDPILRIVTDPAIPNIDHLITEFQLRILAKEFTFCKCMLSQQSSDPFYTGNVRYMGQWFDLSYKENGFRVEAFNSEGTSIAAFSYEGEHLLHHNDYDEVMSTVIPKIFAIGFLANEELHDKDIIKIIKGENEC